MSTQRLELTWIGKNHPDYDIANIEPRILIEDPEKSYGDPSSENILIHGDNLLALKALLPEYEGKVKCIYIDPPYNTGKAFEKYDDNVEHSLWLSLMKARIELLRILLKDDWFLCCQIDDSEGQYLKVLLDEIFWRQNYLTTLYVQVRYPNKTLAEDSDYQKVIEQCHVYAKNKTLAKINRPKVEYDTDKFEWEIKEITKWETLPLWKKEVTIFKPWEYEIRKVSPSLTALKETWATWSLARVSGSAWEFFEFHLAGRKQIDGLNCLYKVSWIGEDGLGFRYISWPKKESANKWKFYSWIPLKRLEELKLWKSFKHLPISNFYDYAWSFWNCRLEGWVDFKGWKKPETLLQMILGYFSNPQDFVLDSFLGSGSTAAVAHKMGRKWIGIEMGNHAYTHCKVRLDKVIDNEDQWGITKSVDWKWGGGYKFYELAPSFITTDEFGNRVIDEFYDDAKLVRAMCKLLGYTFSPSDTEYYKQGVGTGRNYLYVTTQMMSAGVIRQIVSHLGPDDSLTIATKKYEPGAESVDSRITIKKIPQSVLKACQYGKKEYLLPIRESAIEEVDWEDEEDVTIS